MTLAERIVDALDDGVFALDRDWRVTWWNRRIAGLARVASEHAIGRHLFDVVPAWTDSEQQPIARAFLGTRSVSRALPLAIAGPCEATYLPLDAGPIEGGVLAIVREASADALRDRLEESDARFRIMADTSPVLLWMSGSDAQCTFFNQPWLAFTGRSLEAELGNGWAEGVHPEDFQRCMDTYLSSFVERRPFRMEYRLRRADGQFRWLLDTGVPRYLPSGEFAGYIGSCVDVTDSKLLRDDLDRRVRERTAELEAFTYSVSHDLRAPLRGITGFAAALLEDYASVLDAAGVRYLQRVRDGAEQMGVLIDHLLQLSKVGRAELHAEPCDLSQLARAAADELRRREPDRAVDVHIEDGLVIDGDSQLIRIALDNLLDNAWKFTGKTEHARIELSARRLDGETVYAIRDNGVGFDMSDARQLFSAFQRLHHHDEFPGTGIGLATVQRIVARHGGRIWAEAAVGRGATFFLTLPRRAPGDAA